MTFPRILTSSKFQASMVATVIAAIPLYFTLANKSADASQKQLACNVFMVAIAAAWGISIHATGTEDAAAKSQPSPAVQVNSGDTQTISSNAPAASSLTAPPATPAAPSILTPELMQAIQTESVRQWNQYVAASRAKTAITPK